MVSAVTSPQNKTQSDREIPLAGIAAEYALLVILIGVFLWRGFLPGWRKLNSDFPNYYLAGRLYRQGYALDRVYEWIWFQRQKDHAGIDQPLVEYLPNTLFLALVVSPLSRLSALQAEAAADELRRLGPEHIDELDPRLIPIIEIRGAVGSDAAQRGEA